MCLMFALDANNRDWFVREEHLRSKLLGLFRAPKPSANWLTDRAIAKLPCIDHKPDEELL